VVVFSPSYHTKIQYTKGAPMSELTPETLEQVQLQVNNVFLENIRATMAGMSGSSDAKRPRAWCEYGYPEVIEQNMLYNMYDRNALAFGSINTIHGKCFESNPEIFEGEETEDESKQRTAWDKEVAKILKDGDLLDYFAQAYLYRMVIGWSGLLIQYQDGGKWAEPVGDKPKGIVKLIPAWASQLTPGDINANADSDNYGEPRSWQYNEGDLKNNTTTAGASVAARQITVHPDRILILGDWRTGRSMLRSVYNNFINIEKIEGGSGESFLKNAARQIAMNFDKDVKLAEIAKVYNVPMTEFQSILDKAARSFNQGIDSIMMTQGAQVSAISSVVPDPLPHYNTNLQSIASGMRAPAKVLVGMQTGERASSEDLKQFNKTCQGIRTKDIDKDLRGFISLIAYAKVIKPVSEFYIHWDDLSESTQMEKLENGLKAAEIVAKVAPYGINTLTGDQIVTISGFEPQKELAPLPELPDPEADQPQTSVTQ
jgi:hypothetical protein